MGLSAPFKVGVPQTSGDVHLLPCRIAAEQGILARHAPEAELVEFPGGTGEVVQALSKGTISIGVGLTEGLILGAANGAAYRIVATLVETPLRWTVLVATDSPWRTTDDLKGKSIGISTLGSGSHIHSLRLAHQKGWKGRTGFSIRSLGGLEQLLAGLRSGAIDAFLWESLVIQCFLDRGEFRAVDEVLSPWPAFMVAARLDFLRRNPDAVDGHLRGFQEAVLRLQEDRGRAIDLIANYYRLSPADGRRWLDSVRYSVDGELPLKSLQDVATTLRDAKIMRNRVDVTRIVTSMFAPLTFR